MSDYGLDRLRERIASRAKIGGADECWSCVSPNARGYGQISIGRAYYLLHRVAWALEHGREPGSLLVCHTCDNRACCNPDHLFLGTALDNIQDMIAKGRCKPSVGKPRFAERGKRFTYEQVTVIRADARPIRQIAADWGVSPAYIWMIRAEKIWSRNRTTTSRHDGRRTASFATDVKVAAARNNSGGGRSCKQAAAGGAYSTTQLTSPSIAPSGQVVK